MFREIIKDKYTGDANVDWSDFEKNYTSQIDEANQPWMFAIPNDLLKLTVEIVDAPFFFRGIPLNKYHVHTTKIPIIRTFELTKNIVELSDTKQLKESLEQYVNGNFTHVYQVVEERKSAILRGRVMNEVVYWVRGTKIEYSQVAELVDA